MCGIAGIVRMDGAPLAVDSDGRILRRMGDAMLHRGPDDGRAVLWNNVGMVFRRLSIIDLAGGPQPFDTPDGRISSMTNGEIYNHHELRAGLAQHHTLRTASDCEVLPYLYLDHGLEMFQSINGMFATALLDRKCQRLLLARDRFGEKPLFYCLTPDGRSLVFASELKALFAHPDVPRIFDWKSMLTRVQNFDMAVGERPSGFVGIERIPAASLLDISLSDGRFNTHRYWQLPDRLSTDNDADADTCIEQYRFLLEDSVRLRAVADVGCGLFLSGGIDSSALAALLAHRQAMPTFSIHNASTREDAVAAVRVATHLGMPNHLLSFEHTAGAATADDWRRILWSCEYPDINAEQFFKYYLHAFARRRYPNLKVILLGQGSDEFNGGYMGMLLDRHPPYAETDWQHMGDEILKRDNTHLAYTSGLVGRVGSLLDHGVINPEFISTLGGRKVNQSIWNNYTRFWQGNLDTHLWHEDRTAAAHSVENRVPFLDHRLVEFLARIPEHLHAALFTDKRILRRSVAGLLPEDIIHRRKGPLFYGENQYHTFRMMNSILLHNHGELLDRAVEGSRLTGGPINADRLRSFAARIAESSKMDDFEQLLVLVNMGVLAQMAATLDIPAADDRSLRAEEIKLNTGGSPPQSGRWY